MNNATDVVDVNSAGSHIGRDQHLQLSFSELTQRALTRALLHVAMHGLRVDAEFLQVARHTVTVALGLAEHQQLWDALADRANNLVLVHVMDPKEQVVHRADRVGGFIDSNRDRIGLVRTNEVADIAVESCREKHRLVAAITVPKDPFDLRSEPVISHPIGFIKRDDLNAIEADLVRLDEIDQAQRRRNDDFNALGHLLNLVMPRRSAVDGQHGHPGMTGNRLQHFGNLHGQFASRHQDKPERTHRLSLVGDASEHRHAECQCLA